MTQKTSEKENPKKKVLDVGRTACFMLLGIVLEVGTGTFVYGVQDRYLSKLLPWQSTLVQIGLLIMAFAVVFITTRKRKAIVAYDNDLTFVFTVLFAIITAFSDNFFGGPLQDLVLEWADMRWLLVSIVCSLVSVVLIRVEFWIDRQYDVIFSQSGSKLFVATQEEYDKKITEYKRRYRIVFLVGLALVILTLAGFALWKYYYDFRQIVG